MTHPAEIMIRSTVVGGTSSGLSGLTRAGRTRRVASMRVTRTGEWLRITVAEAERALRTGRITVWGEEYAAVDANAPAKPAAPTYRDLDRACDEELKHLGWYGRDGNFGDTLYAECSNLIDGGRVNANDTRDENPGEDFDWEGMFRGSVAVLLSDRSCSEAAREWFAKHGLTF